MNELISSVLLITTLFFPVLAWSPSGGYAPGRVVCPNTPLLRSGQNLLPQEVDYVNERNKITNTALLDFVKRADGIDFDVQSLVSGSNIKIGLAFSGGGFRAMLVGGGQFAALDSRTEGSTDKGHLGGLLQASTYFAGLSGGSWLLASIYMQNFTTIDALLSHPDLWNLTTFILDEQDVADGNFTQYAILDPLSKSLAGFSVSITDVWGRLLSQKFVDLPYGGPSLEWSDMTNWDWFQAHKAPYPIFLATDRMPIENLASPNASIYEITPYELGSFDAPVNAFAPLKYLGTEVVNGLPQGVCNSGFDNSGFLFGTSSSVFDLLIHNALETLGPSALLLKTIVNPILQTLTADVGLYNPNPFKGYVNELSPNSPVTTGDTLYLVDGGENGIVLPLQPLLHPDRDVDIIFAFDTNVDTPFNWPNGSSLVKQYRRQFNVDPATPFPYVPDESTFVNEGLINRPSFFGCDGANLTSLGNTIPPLLVYMPNNPYTYWSNTSVLKLTYNQQETLGLINNGYNIVTQLNGTRDADWQSCVTCAIVHREVERRQLSPSPFCQQCFDRYCWNGKINDVQPLSTAPDLDPKLLGKPYL